MKEINCIYCSSSSCGQIRTQKGWICPDCIINRLDKLESENKRLRSALESIRDSEDGARDMHETAVEALKDKS